MTRMRAATIFGLGTSTRVLDLFRAKSTAEWIEGAPASSADADAVLVFGGDGTIHRQLQLLVRLGLPVLVVPAGSGNDFARSLNMGSVRESVEVWLRFEQRKLQPQAIDLGVITPIGEPDRPRYFCCVAGCGLDSATAERANTLPRWLRGHGGYALALLPALFKFPAFPLRLAPSGDGAPSTKLTLLAAFANTPFYGGGMRVAPHADFSDGKLDVCRLSAVNPFRLFCLFPTVYFGRHLRVPEVEYSRTERIRVETDSPIPIYADGEFVCNPPVEISVAPGALKVIADLKPLALHS